MASPVADIYYATSGATIAGGRGGALAAIGFDAQTPHQISVRALHSRALDAGATANVYYRVFGASTWIDGGALFWVKQAEVSETVAECFAGWILGLTPGVTYDVRIDLVELGVTASSYSSRATRSLPTEGAAQTKSANTGNFAATMAGAVAGDVIVLSAGTYTLSSFNWASPGTVGSPVVVRGASRTGVILVDTTDNLLRLTGDNCTFEDMTFRGSQTDGGGTAPSRGAVFDTTRCANWTFRRITFDGFDRAIKAFVPIDGLLVYDCELLGNNAWSQLAAEDAVGSLFNDDAVGMPGQGNCVWNCTFQGHGDVIKLTTGGGNTERSRACYVHHNWVKWSGDDFMEMDDVGGNCCGYNNLVYNTTTACSAADTYGGPVGLVRNVFVNQARHPLKLNGTSQGARIWNNTFVSTTKITLDQDHGIRDPSSTNYRFDYRNNVLVYRGAGDAIKWGGSLVAPTTDYNAWYPNRNFLFGSGSGPYSDLAAAKTAYSPRMAHDVVTVSNPFASTVTLGADYTTAYSGTADFALLDSATPKGAGIAIPGVTDGFSGAAPDMGAMISGLAFGAVGCSWNRPVAAWAADAVPSTFISIPGTALSVVDPDPSRVAAYAGTGGFENTVSAWNGLAFDGDSGVGWSTALGGHSNYFGNGVYKWTLNQAAPAWTMVRSPSVVADYTTAAGTASTYSDGRPRSTHSYNACVYIPTVGPALAGLPGRTHDGGLGSRAIIRFNESTGAATFGSDPVASGSSTGVACCFDSTRGTSGSVWRRQAGTSTMQRYDVAADTWTNVGSSQAYASTMSMTYIPGHDVILLGNGDDLGGSQSFQWAVFDCATGNYFTPTFTGAPSVGVAHTGGLFPGLCQPVWVPSLGAALAWDNGTSTTQLLKIKPPTSGPTTNAWTLSYLSVASGNAVTPSAAQPNGTYGRVGFWKAGGVLVFFNQYTEAGYAFKV